MSIAYKVVDKKTRHGSNFVVYLTELFQDRTFEEVEDTIKYLRLKRYFPIYKKGKIVKAAPDSVGIFCFNDKDSAFDFMNNNEILEFCNIVSVRGIGKSLNVKYISSNCGSCLYYVKSMRDVPPPIGTVFYNSVEVLE